MVTDIKTVGVIGAAANTVYSLVVKPEITSYDQLRGKTIAVSLPVDTISIATRQLLEKHGLKESDFKAKELIGTPVRSKCLQDGECDASPLGQPEDMIFLAKGYSLREIAVQLDAPLGTVKSALSRGLAKLRELEGGGENRG